jgi:regulator of sigma E protease
MSAALTLVSILVSVLGLALLMIVHEGGHYFAARWFGMRVLRFSIGFGPTIWKRKAKDGPTVYQVAALPFMAYVQIAGMNPYEEIDPNDRESYANASLWARAVTIAAGPLTNYFFASVLIFFGLILGGKEVADETSLHVVVEAGPAQVAGIVTGDRILEVNGVALHRWDDLRKAVSAHPGETIQVTVEHDGAVTQRPVTPDRDRGLIHVTPPLRHEPVGFAEAAKMSIVAPPLFVYENVRAIGRVIAGKEKLQVSGPVGIVKETARQAKFGVGALLPFLGMLSAYLGAFNLLPFPALDGGRLLFLGAEAISRRRPDAKVEAHIHAIGLVMLLTLILFVTYSDFRTK